MPCRRHDHPHQCTEILADVPQQPTAQQYSWAVSQPHDPRQPLLLPAYAASLWSLSFLLVGVSMALELNLEPCAHQATVCH